MALLRALARLRSTCGWQLRTSAPTSQHVRKTLSCSYSADTSTNEGSLVEEKLENPVILSDTTSEHMKEDAVQPEESKDSQFKDSIKVGAPFLRFVVGQGGSTKTSIENSTNTRISIPPPREVRSNVTLVVRGASQESVNHALSKIKAVLQRAEKNSNLQYTHFISLPLASHEGLVEQLRSFKSSVLNDEQQTSNYVSWFPKTAQNESLSAVAVNTTEKVSKMKPTRVLDPDLEGFFSEVESSDDEEEHYESPSSKISSSLFIKPETVHITVVMLKLFTDERVKVAAEVLEGVQPRVLEILDGKEPKVFLRGVDCFRGTPAEARVLAMKVVEPDDRKCLERACHAIKDAYAEAGLVAIADMKQELTLHATLMNTALGRRLRKKPFDARRILAKYRLQDWGEYTINDVHLSQRFFYDTGGYYRCCGSFPLTSAAVSDVSA